MTEAEAQAALVETRGEIDQARAELQKIAAANQRRVIGECLASDKLATQELRDAFYERAMANTGLTREQIDALAVEYARQATEPPKPARVSRETVDKRGVPERHLRSVYDAEPVACDALRLVRDFLASDLHFLVLAGAPGVRKSGSAAWALTIRAGMFLSADEVVSIAGARTEETLEQWRDAKRLDLLVVDDLGTEFHDRAGWFRTAFERLLFARYDACVKTIITTRLDAEGFREVVGDPVYDRIREAGRFVLVGGTSVRGGR